MILKFLSAAAVSLVAQMASAAPVAFKCDVTKIDIYNWVAPEYGFRINDGTGKAQAVSRYPDWTEAQLKDRGSKGYRLIWNVTLKSTEGQAIRMRYQANLDKAGGFKVRGSFVNLGASNKPYGTGECKFVQ